MLKSHPGKLLQDHLLAVANTTRDIVAKTRTDADDTLLTVAYLIGLTHDLGKSTQYFQDHLNKGYKGVLSRHSALSSLFTFYIVKDYLDEQDIPDNYRDMLEALSVFVVKKHHSDLSGLVDTLSNYDYFVIEKQIQAIDNQSLQDVLHDIGVQNWSSINTNTLRKWMEEFRKEHVFDLVNGVIHALSDSNSPDYYFITNLLFSALTNADTVDAAIQTTANIPDCIINPNTIEQYQHNLQVSPLTTLRQQAYQEAMDNIEQQIQQGLPNRLMLLTLPTGLGKTITSFAIANSMKQALGVPYRIIYAVPFINIIEQNADVFEDLVTLQYGCEPTSDILLTHHHLGDVYYKTDDTNYDVSQSEVLIETWNSSIIVTTFVQLVHTLIGNSKSMLLKYNKLAHSIIILDEAQALPLEYWKLISNMLNDTLEALDSYAIVMTATKPLYFDGVPLVSNKYDVLNRYVVDANTYIDIESMAQFVDMFTIEPNKTYLFVMNTVREAEDLYAMLQNRITDRPVGFLSSRVVPKQRRDIIAAAKRKEIPILVSTQVVEAGVDLDFDVVVRDFAPMEAIVQSAGRCNRNGLSSGQVYITRFRNNGRYYADYIYNDILLDLTYDLITHTQFEECNINQLFDKYMQKVQVSKNTDTLSDRLYTDIAKLRYDTVSKFQVIKNKVPEMDVFVEADEDASRVWQQAVEIMSIENALERKNRFKEMKKDFYNYVISVPVTTKPDKNMHVLR